VFPPFKESQNEKQYQAIADEVQEVLQQEDLTVVFPCSDIPLPVLEPLRRFHGYKNQTAARESNFQYFRMHHPLLCEVKKGEGKDGAKHVCYRPSHLHPSAKAVNDFFTAIQQEALRWGMNEHAPLEIRQKYAKGEPQMISEILQEVELQNALAEVYLWGIGVPPPPNSRVPLSSVSVPFVLAP